MYLHAGTLQVEILGRGFTWFDTGTVESLMEAAEFVRVTQKTQNMMISSIEEVSYRMHWIDGEQLLRCADKYGKSAYGKHLHAVYRNLFVK